MALVKKKQIKKVAFFISVLWDKYTKSYNKPLTIKAMLKRVLLHFINVLIYFPLTRFKCKKLIIIAKKLYTKK